MHNQLNTLENRLYQLIISRLDGERLHSRSYRKEISGLVSKGIGGFIIFGGEKDYIKAFIEKIQSISEIPLFIASDIERGVGQQIEGGTGFPCQMSVRAAVNKDRQEEVAVLRNVIRAIAHEAIDIGINIPLIPVLDVNQNPANPIICTRAFSDDPSDVSAFGSQYIEILEEAGLISCAKHFPGHGDTSVDSHISLPEINKSFQDLMAMDILPFIEAVKAGVSSIMVGHLQVPAIDSAPASLSKKIVNDLLRERLGLEGLIMTDALNMSALSGIDNVPARCINAGVDLLLHPANAGLTVRGLIDAIRSGLLDEGAVDAAINRILKIKAKLAYIKRVEVDYPMHSILSKCISDMSITIVKSKEGLLPVTGDDRVKVFFVGEERFHKPVLWEQHFRHENSPSPSPLPRGERVKVRGAFPGETTMSPRLTKGHENPSPPRGEGQGEGEWPYKTPMSLTNENEICSRTTHAPHSPPEPETSTDEIIIFAVFSEVSAWKGSSGIMDEERKQVADLTRKARRSIVISFGSPYILSHFNEADILIAAYEANEQTQEAVIKCLKGEMDIRGRLPVSLTL